MIYIGEKIGDTYLKCGNPADRCEGGVMATCAPIWICAEVIIYIFSVIMISWPVHYAKKLWAHQVTNVLDVGRVHGRQKCLLWPVYVSYWTFLTYDNRRHFHTICHVQIFMFIIHEIEVRMYDIVFLPFSSFYPNSHSTSLACVGNQGL